METLDIDRKLRLKDIKATVADEMDTFQEAFSESMKSRVFLINKVAGYLIKQRSKKIRPMLVILASKLCGEPNKNTYQAAVLVELIHTATLIHDDVVDGAELRRGIPSINAVWKNKISVLMGDYLFSKSLINMIKLKDFEALELLSDTAERLSSGEILQIEKARSDGMDEDVYYEMIRDKTASLISAACKLGAITVGSNTDKAEALAEYGENLGIAFQIKDDLFEFVGKKSIIGKPVGQDVKENMITLPLLHTVEKLPDKESRKILKTMKRGAKSKQVKEIVRKVANNGGVSYARERLREYTEAAIDALEIFPDGQYKQALIDFAEFNMIREK
ncbi:MAG: polyprenyl synthetase family protein [Candidatus Marinimicrobia bacterium]|nr:polyprenyl synthetase family protein [Candidatus Neomarinimicrobiota bacterium]MCF7830159.1 polyprenyl synthetase family protein [Candidatus Neomarinimicrobiota bacterium]MCF7882107.1 polyprenyl synthetase family protein [Candidatus Neomarinimicrobiota bacterium]